MANKLQKVIGVIVDPSQSGFIPHRQILDNVMLASDLLKGYGRKGLSPRCYIKIDLRKAYDSIEWSFVETMMLELGVPNRMVGWIMTYITTYPT